MTSRSPRWGWGAIVALATMTSSYAWADDPPHADDGTEDPAENHGPKAGDDPPQPVPEPAPEPVPPMPGPGTNVDDVQRALALHDEAKQLYARGQYPEAIAKLEEAATLDPNAIPLHYNLGLIEEKMGHLDRALVHFRRTLELEQNPRERQHLAKVIKRIEGARALDVLGHSQGARLDGGTGPAPWSGDVRPEKGEAPGPTTIEIAAYATAGGALLAFATASALLVRAADLDPGEDARTGEGITIDQLEADAAAAHRHAIGADVMFGLGAASAVSSLVLVIVIGTGADPGASAPEVALDLGLSGGSFTWRF